MKELTKETALDNSIRLWEAVVEQEITSVPEKEDLCIAMFGSTRDGCSLCEYSLQQGQHLVNGDDRGNYCPVCPYCIEFGFCEDGAYGRWHLESDLKWGKRFLDQLYLIRGKSVSEQKDSTPKEEWVDVTKECTVDLYHSELSATGSLIRLRHNGSLVFEIGNEGKAWRNPKYKVETASKTHKVNWFRVLKHVVK